jgi:hypothetical protein
MLLGKIISSFILFTGTRHIFAGIDSTGFKITQVITRISKIKSLSVVVADKAYDSEDNHVMVREKLKGFSDITTT